MNGTRKKRVFSGIQPTGTIHIGNYFGAIRNWVSLIDEYDCIFCIVDYHAMTIEYDTKQMPHLVFDAVVNNIAAGIDPEKCALYCQSAIPEHTTLAWMLNCVAPLGQLERMTQFKQKAEQHRENINMGLLAYPVLQTADIALFKGEAVPVGEDQIQHLELCRDIVEKFNTRFDTTLPLPKVLLSPAARVMGLDAVNKMSKSLNNYISLIEESAELWKKLAPAVTDPARKRRSDPGTPEICNIFSYHQLVSSKEEIEQVSLGCRTAGIGCLDCKKILYNNMEKVIGPIRERAKELSAKPDYIAKVLREGAEKIRPIAKATMREIYEKVGFTYSL